MRTIAFRIDSDDYQAIQDAANKAGMPHASTWLRSLVYAALDNGKAHFRSVGRPRGLPGKRKKEAL